ncbi:MAG: hypothetical protein AAF517_16315, partial [Planctomycetota bacterium]
DLMMKLWSFNFRDSTPTTIPGFLPRAGIAVNALHTESHIKYPATRSWLSARDQGVEVAADLSSVRFAPTFTRIYNAGSNDLRPGQEAEANYSASVFSSWWNANYGRVADFEPEYHRLNQIMKWALIVRWLAESDDDWLLSALKKLPVERNLDFASWYAENGSRLRTSVQLPFVEHTSEETECIEILESDRRLTETFEISWLSGGVSLPGAPMLVRKTEAAKHWANVEPDLRRLGVDPTTSARSNRADAVGSLDGRLYRMSRSDDAVAISAEASTRFEGELAFGRGLRVARKVHSSGGRLEIQDTLGEHELHRIEVSRAGAGIKVRAEDGAVESALEWARSFVRSRESVNDGKSFAMALPEYGGVLRVEGDRWALVSSDRVAAPFEGEPALKFAADPVLGEPFEVAFLSRRTAESVLESNPITALVAGLDQTPTLGLVRDLPEAAALASLRVRDEVSSGFAAANGFFIEGGRSAIDRARNLQQQLTGQDLSLLTREADSEGFAFSARRLVDGRLASLERQSPESAELRTQIVELLGPDSPLTGITAHKDRAGVRLATDGRLGLSSRPTSSDIEIAKAMKRQMQEDGTLVEVYSALDSVSLADVNAMRTLRGSSRASYASFSRLEEIPNEFAVVDARLAEGQDRVALRSAGDDVRTMSIKGVSGETVQSVIRDVDAFYADPNSRGDLRKITKPYYELLQEIAQGTTAKNIVVVEPPNLNSQLVWNLHGGDRSVRFHHDQPNIAQSVANAGQRIAPRLEGARVLSTVRLEGSLDEKNEDLEPVATIAQEIEEFVLSIDEDVEFSEFIRVMVDPEYQQLTLVARVKDDVVLFSDIGVPVQQLRWNLQLAASEKEMVHVISNEPEKLGAAFADAGIARRVMMSRFTRGTVDTFQRALDNCRRFYRSFATRQASFDREGFERLLADIGEPSVVEQLRLASRASGEQVVVDTRDIPPAIRRQLSRDARRALLQRMKLSADPQVSSIDAVVDKLERDRIKEARAIRTFWSRERKANRAKIFKSIPLLKAGRDIEDRARVQSIAAR